MSDSTIHNLLHKGTSRVIDEANLTKRLERGDKLTVKFGIDPSGTIVHIGHMVPILKLKAFQALGHRIVLTIGDATAQVGDASDKDAERPMLKREETRKNAEIFLQKFAKVLDLEKTEVYWNSEGLDAVNFAGVGELAKNFSVAEMLDRDNFSKRYKGGVRISLQEFLYPIMQGYDSVAIAKKYGACDVELGGNDQYFNLLAGRTLMEAHGLPKQDIMTFDLLVGSDGKKMSKTSPNTVAIDEAPQSMYQKLINIQDDLIVKYFELATDATLEEVDTIRKRLEGGEHPNTLKIELAQRIITMYHGKPYDAKDEGNIESYNIGYIVYVNILIDNGILTKEDIVKMNGIINLEDFVKVIGKLSGIDNNDALNIIRNRIVYNNGIRTDDSIIELLKSLGESPPGRSKSKEAWIKRAKEIGLKIKTGLETMILFKEFVEFAISMCGLDIADEESSTKYKYCTISDLLKLIDFCATSGDVRNALAGNSIRVNGEVITDPKFLVTLSSEGTLVEMGKKKAKRVFL